MLAAPRDQLVAVDKMAKMAKLVKEVEMGSKVQIVPGLNLVIAPSNISIMETLAFPFVPLLLKVGLGVLHEKNMLEFQGILLLLQRMPKMAKKLSNSQNNNIHNNT